MRGPVSGGRLGPWVIGVWLACGDAIAGPGKPAHKLVNVADTRGMDGGLSHWIADVYNTSFWLYGLLVVVVMVGMGLVLGLVSDRLMGMLGIDLGRMQHHE